MERTYRNRIKAHDLSSFRVVVRETDLWIATNQDLEKETTDLVFDCRHQLESYIQSHPEFLTSLKPYPDDPYAPAMIREMIDKTRSVNVGPMACVAGAIAQYVGKGLLNITDQVIVENGGDIYLRVDHKVTVSILAGNSPLSEKIGLIITSSQMPLGICSSSGTVGHSLSMGLADVVCLLSPSAVMADGAATALGNRIRDKKDIERVTEWANDMRGILGGVVIMHDKMTAWGDVELVGL